MPVTFTIKGVSDELADRLRQRAAAQRRSLQKELLVILEGALAGETGGPGRGGPRIAEPRTAPYDMNAAAAPRRQGSAETARLSLEELWERARRLGAAGASESTDLVRRDRDERHRRR
ncbi:MAG TPA: hypothetical protein VFW92_03175 [Candidatus Limnocylindrales bacterium]|jgi:hypothetical protein|nr:hypothetical protein [Candidatus Limnocylindrales bacterium]